MLTEEKVLTGYPSIDKPWLKYYSEEAINAKLPECTIYEYLWENNKAHLNDVALIYFGKKITYKTLFENIEKTTSAFVSLGIEKGDIVTIQSLSLPQVIYMIYALSKLGAIANLIYATNTPKEVIENLTETKSKLYVCMDSIFEKFTTKIETEYLEKVILISVVDEMPLVIKTLYRVKSRSAKRKVVQFTIDYKAFLNFSENEKVNIEGKSDDAVIMVYTGGTTGKSKGVLLSNLNMNVAALQYFYCGFERGNVFLSVLPPFIAFGVTVSMHMPLGFGLKTALGVSANPSEIAEFVQQYKPQYVICGTMQAEKMMNVLSNKDVDLSHLICFSVGGDILTPALEEKLNDFFGAHNSAINVAQGYAMSETAAATACSTYTPTNRIFKKKTVGIPLVYTIVKIVDTETNKELPYGEQGEICINTPCTMIGYYKNEEETNNILKTHEDGKQWIHTGDIGCVDEEGFIKIVGRIKRIILTFESEVCHKVFPKLLEDSFLGVNGVKNITIVAKAINKTLNELVAFVVLNEDTDNDVMRAILQEFANKNFEPYERPSKYVFVERLPYTVIGKIDYRALEKEAEELKI